MNVNHIFFKFNDLNENLVLQIHQVYELYSKIRLN